METLLLLVWSGGSRLCMVILTTSLTEIHLPTNSGYVSGFKQDNGLARNYRA